MKKLLGILLVLLLTSSSASAAALSFDNWQFNPNGADAAAGYGLFSPIDEINILGTTLVNGTIPDASGHGTFDQFGTFAATSFSNDGIPISGFDTGLGGGYELTFVMSNTSGTYQYDPNDDASELLFTNSTFEIYLDTSMDYGNAGNIAGAANGTLIAAFSLLSGSGEVDFDESGGAGGHTNLTFIATQMMAGVWFTEDGTDMSTLASKDILITIVDTNNDVLGSGDHNAVEDIWSDEYDGKDGLTSGDYDDELGAKNPEFFLRSDGSVAMGMVPEPTTIMLFGFGLLGIAGISRKKIR